MSLLTFQSQLWSEQANFDHTENVKNTFIHYCSSFFGNERRRSSSAPPFQRQTHVEDFFKLSDEDNASCTDSSQTSFSMCEADSGASTPECFSPRRPPTNATCPLGDPVSHVLPAENISVFCFTKSSQIHTITLRCADGVPLGLAVVQHGHSLMVESVAMQGAVEAWNKQCQISDRLILPGDHILAVNSAQDSEEMRLEIERASLLKLVVSRGPNHCEESYIWVPRFFNPMVATPCLSASALACYSVCTEEQHAAIEEHEGESRHHVWHPECKKFIGKHTKVTKTELLPLGEFAFTIHAHAVSSERGGSSFQASEGKGTVHVKCNSENLGTRALRVTVGDETHIATHNFTIDSICKIPKVFNFKREAEVKGKIAVVFDFL